MITQEFTHRIRYLLALSRIVEYKTKWFEYTNEAAGNKTEAKMWTSDDVPGMMVKMESKTTGTVAATVKMEVVEVKKP